MLTAVLLLGSRFFTLIEQRAAALTQESRRVVPMAVILVGACWAALLAHG